MSAATPTVGRIVNYRLTQPDVERINKRRADFDAHRHASHYEDTGYVAHFGNVAHAGDVVPAVVVRVWTGGLINGQAFLDGNDTLWLNSVGEGDGFGQWSWPPRVEG